MGAASVAAELFPDAVTGFAAGGNGAAACGGLGSSKPHPPAGTLGGAQPALGGGAPVQDTPGVGPRPAGAATAAEAVSVPVRRSRPAPSAEERARAARLQVGLRPDPADFGILPGHHIYLT